MMIFGIPWLVKLKGNQVVLTNIEKAIAFRRMDNTDLFEFVKKGQGLYD
jgi:hypothetical protein